MERWRLKGTLGDKVNAVLSAAAMTFSKLLAALGALLSFLLARLVVRFALRSPRRIPAADAGETFSGSTRITRPVCDRLYSDEDWGDFSR